MHSNREHDMTDYDKEHAELKREVSKYFNFTGIRQESNSNAWRSKWQEDN